jgi:hypothetical protein
LTYFANSASVCRTTLFPWEVTPRRDAAQRALLFPDGHRLQFDDAGFASIIHCSAAADPRPMFFRDEVNAPVDLDALGRHISGERLVDCSRLRSLIVAILAETQTQCYLNVNARMLAQQRDADKSILFHYGTGRDVGKTLLAMLGQRLGLSQGVWAMITKDVKTAFISETRNAEVIVKTLKRYQTQAVLVVDEVGAKGVEDYNRDNVPIVFNALKGWQDSSKALHVGDIATSVPASKCAGIILTGNTGSPADAFSCSLSPGDAERVFPLDFGRCKEEDAGYEARAKAARELREECIRNRESMLLQFLALMIDYAKVPLAQNKHAWPTMPSGPTAAGAAAAADKGAVVTDWCEANAARFIKQEGARLQRRDVWKAMAACDLKAPGEARGRARDVYCGALNDFIAKRFRVQKQPGTHADIPEYPGVMLIDAVPTDAEMEDTGASSLPACS